MDFKTLLKNNIKLLDANLAEMKSVRREMDDIRKKFGWRWNQDHPIEGKGENIPDHDCHAGPEAGCDCRKLFKF